MRTTYDLRRIAHSYNNPVTPKAFVQTVQETLEPHRNPEKAAPMSAYMKNLFPFLGLPTQERQALEKPLLQELKPHVSSAFLDETARRLWALPEREYQYLALNLLEKYAKHGEASALGLVEHLVTHKSWWDSIDPIASVLGKMIGRFPEWLPTMDEWSTHPNFWLKRTAILYQRGYRSQTDAARLFRYCLANASDKEFFIRKAIGWALREYSKVNPDAVREFIEQHGSKLSPLSLREGSKYL